MQIQETEDSQALMGLGSRIKQFRMNKGMSQTELATSCHMEKSSMSKIESGQVNISYLTLIRLSKCLEVNIRELCGD